MVKHVHDALYCHLLAGFGVQRRAHHAVATLPNHFVYRVSICLACGKPRVEQTQRAPPSTSQQSRPNPATKQVWVPKSAPYSVKNSLVSIFLVVDLFLVQPHSLRASCSTHLLMPLDCSFRSARKMPVGHTRRSNPLVLHVHEAQIWPNSACHALSFLASDCASLSVQCGNLIWQPCSHQLHKRTHTPANLKHPSSPHPGWSMLHHNYVRGALTCSIILCHGVHACRRSSSTA